MPKDVPIEYPLRVEVDGKSFLVTRDPQQVGAYDYNWITGPNSGDGFGELMSEYDEVTDRIMHSHQPTLAEHVDAIRNFLQQVDPATGYIEDD